MLPQKVVLLMQVLRPEPQRGRLIISMQVQKAALPMRVLKLALLREKLVLLMLPQRAAQKPELQKEKPVL